MTKSDDSATRSTLIYDPSVGELKGNHSNALCNPKRQSLDPRLTTFFIACRTTSLTFPIDSRQRKSLSDTPVFRRFGGQLGIQYKNNFLKTTQCQRLEGRKIFHCNGLWINWPARFHNFLIDRLIASFQREDDNSGQSKNPPRIPPASLRRRFCGLGQCCQSPLQFREMGGPY